MRTVEEIYESMLDSYTEHTGLRPSVTCDLAIRLYAVANQIFALEAQGEWVQRQCFPQTAQGEFLEYHGEMRGLTRKSASCATGYLRFSASTPVSENLQIDLGTVALTAGLLRFVTVEEATLKAGTSFVDVRAEAVEAGEGGNIASGLVVSMSVPPVGVANCSNPSAFVDGTESEEDEAFRERILDTYSRLPNGANVAFYVQEALSFEKVGAVAVLPRYRGVSTVDVVLASVSGMPDEELMAEVQEHLEGIREIAVDVLVRAPTTLEMDLQIQITAKDDFQDALSEAKEAVEQWFNGSRLGEELLEAELGNILYQCTEVKNYAIGTDLSNYVVEEDMLPVLNSLVVEEMS